MDKKVLIAVLFEDLKMNNKSGKEKTKLTLKSNYYLIKIITNDYNT